MRQAEARAGIRRVRRGIGRQAGDRLHGRQRDKGPAGHPLGDEHPVDPHVEEVADDRGIRVPRQRPDLHPERQADGRPQPVGQTRGGALGAYQLGEADAGLLRLGGCQLRLEVREEPLPPHDPTP
jgi:hypothetical protein